MEDAAQKLTIDNAMLRQEMKQAAAQRLGSVRQAAAVPMSETERILLRALVLPPTDRSRQRAAAEIAAHPEWLEGMAAADLMEALANAPPEQVVDPMALAPNDASREMLARVLAEDHNEDSAALAADVGGALHTLERRRLERRQRDLRAATAEAERKGDTASLAMLAGERMQVHRALRTL